MNKTEKIISILLGGVLVWYLFTQSNKPQQEQALENAQVVQQNAQPTVKTAPAPVVASHGAPELAPAKILPAKPTTPEQIVTLENDELRLELSSWNGGVKKATLKKYAQRKGDIGEGNPPVEFDFSSSPLGDVGNIREAGLGDWMEYRVESVASNEVVFATEMGKRRVTLGENYQVTFKDDWFSLPPGVDFTLSLGSMEMGDSNSDILSVDSWRIGENGGEVVHHGDDGDSPLKKYLVVMGGGCNGCGNTTSAAGMPLEATERIAGTQKWIALKNRFFVTALVSTSAQNKGFLATVKRDETVDRYRPEKVSAQAVFNPGSSTEVTNVFYIGPKKQAILWDLGMRDVMEFGIWRWICYPILWILNACNAVIPNYGIAIILLTILVRLIFWPLTHKSTVGMKKMQEIQPLMKELQAKYKDNPQRLQQETFALYREHKVNPMSSCLPMLIQIPVFIALFNVLRSAIELRYAPFLWIADLSQPEALGANSWFPWFGGLNILPILMAVTMALQSALTPSTGDKSQQKMMIIMMPVMMLVMFYSFPSALSLYWTLSQVVSIIQMWVIRRQTQAKQKPAFEVIDPPQTRQMRRHS